jgi:hypothetical protein
MSAPFIGPNRVQCADLGTALRLAQWGDFGDAQEVTLKREGYTDYIIVKGGPSGWYVKKMGNKVRARP